MASIEAKERVVRPEAVRAFAGRLRRRIAGLEAVLGRRLPPAGGHPRDCTYHPSADDLRRIRAETLRREVRAMIHGTI